MSRRRRMFDIEMPEDDAPAVPSGPRVSTLGDPRPGPMASAVRETAGSLRERAEAERAIRSENDALAHELVALRRDGLVMQRLPLEAIATTKLTRDRRLSAADEELEELKDSIRDLGLSNPIQVEAAGDGFELVQGFRRLSAFRALLAETGDAAYATIPGVVLGAGETLEALYRRMVDENLVRKDISFAEMAALAQAYADDPGTPVDDVDDAVLTLYRSARRNKRSYIRAFAQMLNVLDKYLEHPQAIPRNLGLAVRRRMETAPETIAELQSALLRVPGRGVEDELAILRGYAGSGEDAENGTPPEGGTFPTGNTPAKGGAARRPRTTFQIASGRGTVRCTASQGRLELRHDVDFSAVDRRRLEQAVQRFLDTLDGSGA